MQCKGITIKNEIEKFSHTEFYVIHNLLFTVK